MVERAICLDKTINLTREIMNREAPIPANVQVSYLLGAMKSFNFEQSDVVIPIEHIGLALYANALAKEQFTVIHPDKNGEIVKDFEPINHEDGYYISSFVKNFAPDSLNWYVRQDGTPLTMDYVGGNVIREDYYKFKQCKANDKEGTDFREIAVREAFGNAMTEYLSAELGANDAESNVLSTGETIDEFVQAEECALEYYLQALKQQSNNLIPPVEDSAQ